MFGVRRSVFDVFLLNLLPMDVAAPLSDVVLRWPLGR
jgi:hypothetical protein